MRKFRPKVLGERWQGVPILPAPMEDIVLVVCPNADNFHPSVFIAYAFFGRGYSIDEPTYDEVHELTKSIPHEKVDTVWRTCRECRLKGVQ